MKKTAKAGNPGVICGGFWKLCFDHKKEQQIRLKEEFTPLADPPWVAVYIEKWDLQNVLNDEIKRRKINLTRAFSSRGSWRFYIGSNLAKEFALSTVERCQRSWVWLTRTTTMMCTSERSSFEHLDLAENFSL
ncbi:hypothetical protein [Hominenteromicrobium sp.]|uniref:hypothetical protein n=1 Tax=Hominenteromicrobium sp. TaxID=3073581 RepID=UPI00399B83D3